MIFGTLYNPAFRVLPASAARVEVSTNGKEFKEVAQTSYTREYPEHGRKMFTDVLEFTPAEARYIKVTLKVVVHCAMALTAGKIHREILFLRTYM